MTKRKAKRLSAREAQRIATTRERHGPNFFETNARKAGLQTPTKFTSESGSAAARKRWENYRAEKAKKKGKR